TPSTTIDNTLTIASGATVRGRGNITSGYFTGSGSCAVVNNGLISADVAATTLTINPDGFTNNATSQAINGATLSISPTNWSNAANGTILASGGSTVNFYNNWSSAGTINLNASTLNLGGTFSTNNVNL